MAGSPVGFKATRTILNPWYELPRRATIVIPEVGRLSGDSVQITPPCRVGLPQYGIRLLFRDDQVGFVLIGDSPEPGYFIDPIREFLAYKTFVNYNLVGAFSCPSNEERIEEVDTIRFRLERIVRVETDMRVGEETIPGFHHEMREEWLEIAVGDLVQYLSVLNSTLDQATAFYLIGCQNPRCFLVEFYKAVESVRHAFDGESDFLQLLEPYGVTKKDYKEFAKTCNDVQLAPLDIGRHAPQPGAPLYAVDLRNLLLDPRSFEVFKSATVLCRQVIDAYIEFLARSAG